MPSDLAFNIMWDLYYKHGHKGGTAHIYRTDVLKQHPFVLEPGERFIAETFVNHQIDQQYTFATLNKVVTV